MIKKSKKRLFCYVLAYIMVVLIIKVKNSVQVQCKFCQQDFKALGHHQWRGKTRVINREQHHTRALSNVGHQETVETINKTIVNSNNTVEVCYNGLGDAVRNPSNTDEFNCYCGKKFKSLRSLNLHRRSSHIVDISNVRDLSLYTNYSKNSNSNGQENQQIKNNPRVCLKSV